jgi:hypothetical protein
MLIALSAGVTYLLTDRCKCRNAWEKVQVPGAPSARPPLHADTAEGLYC